jgi:DNA-directed RNA polymerase subunit M/transcription elongation factor TFIIS
MKNMVVNMTDETQNAEQDQVITPPNTCPNCLEVGTVSVITKTLGGVTRYYFQCSSCGYRWPVPAS